VDKDEFIAAILEMYPNSFTQSNTQMWIEAYSQVLPDKIDFQELFDDMLENYKATNYAPSTAFFKPYVDKQLDRIRRSNEVRADEAVFKQYLAEKRELMKNDKPMTEPVLTPLELLKQRNNPYNNRGFFTDSQMKLFRCYAGTITMEKLRVKFWQQVGKLILGDRNDDLCRNVQEIC
jgi:hypothetical protein